MISKNPYIQLSYTIESHMSSVPQIIKLLNLNHITAGVDINLYFNFNIYQALKMLFPVKCDPSLFDSLI